MSKLKSALFIINKFSGGGYRPEVEGRIIELCEKLNIESTIEFTQSPGHATELAKSAVDQKMDYAFAVGGDGIEFALETPSGAQNTGDADEDAEVGMIEGVVAGEAGVAGVGGVPGAECANAVNLAGGFGIGQHGVVFHRHSGSGGLQAQIVNIEAERLFVRILGKHEERSAIDLGAIDDDLG